MTLGYESYIIDNVEKYNLIDFKKRLYFENFSCVYIMKGQTEGKNRLCIEKNITIIQVKKGK